ncbi:MAG: DEAD/DEAH box helicase, partial [Cyclobacteriaceae bacterium]|nr:DEAD/DEAH box helicase [Cyclobacteriaceae bacterium]
MVNDLSLDKAQTYVLEFEEDHLIIPSNKKKDREWNRYSYCCLLQLINELHLLDPREHIEHKKYSRQGMINRVLNERIQKAEKAEYRISWADNIHGDHILTNENGVKYTIFLRDFENETGYSDSADSQLNKLGTTKHIMHAFRKINENKSLSKRLKKSFPFIEVFCDPLNEYKITWCFPGEMKIDEQLLISRYFKNKQFIEDEEIEAFLGFIEEAEDYDSIVIRPEVKEKTERVFENELLRQLSESYKPDYSNIKATLFDYQKEGIEFVLFRKAAIIADEMGLGKTMQAISAAIQKKKIFGFNKTLIVCPASIKSQWKSEIEKFSEEKAIIVEGTPYEREEIYKNTEHFFFILNYETILRDSRAINKAGFDFLILDEAQRVKNFETKTAASVKRLNTKHVLVITGTPIENKLIDIYSIMSILDPHFFGPLWEFSYQHCLFDPEKQNKINGYYDLQKLNKKLEGVLIRREKRKVLDQLPNLMQINIPVNLSPLQAEYHASYARSIAKIIRKKFLTPYDLQRLMLLLANMRMVCDSTYLIDDETNESPKLDELKYILLEKLDIANNDTKIIIFSEWIKVHKLIGKMLRENNIGFVELNGKVPVKLRGELIKKFESNPQSKIFLSTEAGGSGLNLQMADTLINFELPWNPAKKNQRIGRIDRLGQKSNKLTIYNLITRDSIEQQIAAGLLVKQNLFEGV